MICASFAFTRIKSTQVKTKTNKQTNKQKPNHNINKNIIFSHQIEAIVVFLLFFFIFYFIFFPVSLQGRKCLVLWNYGLRTTPLTGRKQRKINEYRILKNRSNIAEDVTKSVSLSLPISMKRHFIFHRLIWTLVGIIHT